MKINELINSDWGNGNTLLHEAVSLESIDLVKECISNGADINKVNRVNRTALFYCSSNNDNAIEILHLLLNAGINPNIQDCNGNTAIIYNERYDRVLKELASVTNLDITNSNGYNLLLYGIMNFDVDILKIVLKYTKNLNLTCKNGYCYGKNALLLIATERNKSSIILTLAKSGIDLFLKDKEGRDFYDLCYKNVQKLIVKELPDFIEKRNFYNNINKYNL